MSTKVRQRQGIETSTACRGVKTLCEMSLILAVSRDEDDICLISAKEIALKRHEVVTHRAHTYTNNDFSCTSNRGYGLRSYTRNKYTEHTGSHNSPSGFEQQSCKMCLTINIYISGLFKVYGRAGFMIGAARGLANVFM